ncbi:hypothetical protein P0W64_07585 [Tsukamurella sp. 8F]|uniref:hypothetical protein n=1 Tax=unclassified Tsukamurella TaxID=2633480 RepID=UPI0023B8CCEC|nr:MULTISPECIES: hypothetical protein [unclassified Tsukamurella]MDF0528797.1 hypothetical protein [Tsukamurella sp. 8J]MDF0586632.1 hypothetical protein [Tsukamurella sp. 8F]
MTQPDDPRADAAPEADAAAPEDPASPAEAGPGDESDSSGLAEGYHVEQAYSQAIPEQKPRVQVPPEAVVTGAIATHPPARTGGGGRTLVVALLAVASLAALLLAILVVALGNPSHNSAGESSGQAPQSDAAGQVFKVNDCLYGVASDPQVGDCGNGGSPYRVVKIMPVGQTCADDQPSVSRGRSYCLAPNLNVNYCYSSPARGGWIQPAARCNAPGTVTVVSVVPGKKDDKLCRGAWTKSYFYSNPALTVCVKEY